MNTYTETEAVENGHYSEHFVAGCKNGVSSYNLLSECIEVEVGKKNTFINARCSATVENNSRSVDISVNFRQRVLEPVRGVSK